MGSEAADVIDYLLFTIVPAPSTLLRTGLAGRTSIQHRETTISLCPPSTGLGTASVAKFLTGLQDRVRMGSEAAPSYEPAKHSGCLAKIDNRQS
jgi:hypothetical protein